MKKKRLLSLALCAAAILAGCGKKENETAGGPAAKKLKLAFVSNNAANFWTMARAGCNAAARELGNVEVDFRIPASGSAAEQQQILNDLVAAGVNGIAASPIDPANQIDFLNKIASQTLFITTDSDAPGSKRVCYIGTDNVAAGRQVGQLIKEAIPRGGKIMLFVGKLDAQNAKDRLAGIKEALQGSNVQILDVRTDDTDPVRAQNNAADTLVKYPDIACLVGLWSYNGPAILHAVRNAGQAGQVKIVCFDDDPDTLAGVASGDIYGTVVQQPYKFGYEAITRMDKYLNGAKSALAGVDGKIFIPTIPVTKTNVA
ncbi:MAG: sugar-binding protein, partial [Verrucomicrobia bacterium]|nr:sugar-binding protein [Verrucomicrobiota bacterium]